MTVNTTRISRRRLDPKFFERTFAKNAAVRNTIECNSACQTKVGLACFRMRTARHSHHRFFSNYLNAPREIHFLLR